MKSVPRSRSEPRGRYPLATIAAYGPDRTLATKLVVSVLKRPDRRDPTATRTWTTQAVDVRHDPTIAADVASFVRQHDVKQTVTADRIIGCPHEEGIDYPMGRTCPRCPFWADIDRFTHEPIAPPLPALSPAEILADLSSDEPEPPRTA
ncbi:MAG: preprotein translocase subunit SecA, partial [Acidobacteria bacterium]|nr:preprotein translocase subunit SecA [Acidobacteriota bacterium]